MAAKLALLALANHADEGGTCWPSIGRIARLCGCSEQTARRGLRRLERLQIIDRDPQPGTSDLFQLNFSWLPSTSILGETSWDDLAAVGIERCGYSGGKVVPINAPPCSVGTPPLPNWNPTPTNQIMHPFHGGTRIIIETSLNLLENRDAIADEVHRWEYENWAEKGPPSLPKLFRRRRK